MDAIRQVLARENGRLAEQNETLRNQVADLAAGGLAHAAAAGRVADELREINAELITALEDCITSEGAACFGRQATHPEWMRTRLFAISDIARATLARTKAAK